MSKLIVRPDGSREIDTGRSHPLVPITSTAVALGMGAMAYFGAYGSAVAVGGGGVANGGAPPVGAPNPPTITATVYRTQGDSLWIDGGAYSGSGGDAHDSTLIKVDSTAGGKAYHLDTLGAIERDSVGGNVVALDSGAVVDIVMQYKGASGGWSAPDTLTGVEMAFTSNLHPNMPAALTTVLFNNDGSFDSIQTDGADNGIGWWDAGSWNARATGISDAGNPTGSGSAVRLTHVTGSSPAAKLREWSDLNSTLGGQGTATVGFDSIYYSERRTLEAGQVPCESHSGDTGFKFFYMGMKADARTNGGANNIYLTGCSSPEFSIQTSGTASGGSNTWFLSDLGWGAGVSVGETWHLEIFLAAESANGAGDGKIRVWTDGTLQLSVDTAAFSSVADVGRLFDGMELYHTADNPDTDHAWVLREFYVAASPGS